MKKEAVVRHCCIHLHHFRVPHRQPRWRYWGWKATSFGWRPFPYLVLGPSTLHYLSYVMEWKIFWAKIVLSWINLPWMKANWVGRWFSAWGACLRHAIEGLCFHKHYWVLVPHCVRISWDYLKLPIFIGFLRCDIRGNKKVRIGVRALSNTETSRCQ